IQTPYLVEFYFVSVAQDHIPSGHELLPQPIQSSILSHTVAHQWLLGVSSRRRRQNLHLCIPLFEVPISSIFPFPPVLKPINQSQLNWLSDGILNNMQYDRGSLVIQKPGMYFIYCQLQVYVASCEGKQINLLLQLLVNGSSMKQTVVTLCGPSQALREISHSLFLFLLAELKTGDKVSVQIDPFKYLDVSVLPKSNVLGALKYSGEDWMFSLIRTVAGTCL
uniref:TNF superfamily member 8 n=1 Tax=Salvator merianae TaxID=96440 RepID=A0A8D0DLM6_SALMN